MQVLRTLTRRHRLLAMLLVICALALKATVPAGYMVSQQGKVLTIEICADASGGTLLTRQIVVPSSGAHDKADETHGKAAETCSYASLGFAALGGADAALLALALAFIITLGLAPASSAPLRRIPYVRPPLRGPPATV